MPLTGALQADFSDFVTEANKASAALGVMEAEGKKTGATLAKTGQAVDGMASSGAGLTQLSSGLRLVDQSANAMGISLAKPIGMIDELGQVAGKTTADLGALGTAGAVAGAALAGWSVGRWLADLTGSDEIIGRLTANLLGIGDAAEVAGYKQDILAKASATSGRTITDLNEAMTINYDAVKQHTAAVDTAIHRQALWEKEIRAHRDVLPEITAALANHTATTKQLETQYGMTAAAIEYYVQKTKTQTAAQDEATRKTEAAAAALEKLRGSMFGTDDIASAQQYMAALGTVSNLTKMTADEQGKLNTVLGTAIDAYTRAGEVAPQAMRDLYIETIKLPAVVTGLGTEWGNVGTKVTITADRVIADLKRMAEATAAYEQETPRMVDEAQQVQPPIAAARQEVERMTVAMQDLGRTNQSVWESMIAGRELVDAYAKAGVATGSQIATGGYQFQRQREVGIMPTSANVGSTLNVNVNSTEAGDIATKLVGEMKRSGYRL